MNYQPLLRRVPRVQHNRSVPNRNLNRLRLVVFILFVEKINQIHFLIKNRELDLSAVENFRRNLLVAPVERVVGLDALLLRDKHVLIVNDPRLHHVDRDVDLEVVSKAEIQAGRVVFVPQGDLVFFEAFQGGFELDYRDRLQEDALLAKMGDFPAEQVY